ncbi:rod shape-determining protein MreD [Aggregatibacter actinomycetemcomitans]|uniref:rod shape-determining protein MreD n=1 Tax=Aggregatibacter actinomycetemcomitans TaxID=714 RepID=UPI001E4885DE|nr:rod shape-determining protein MreD [Aggregatibacter actinomycetemcomitans]
MEGRFIFQCFVLSTIFIIALVMEIAPWPVGFQSFKPAWIVLVFTYWTLSIPHRVNIGQAFIIGIIWDMVLGSTLGIHALVLSVSAYLITTYHLILRNLSLWMQSLLVVALVFAVRLSIFFIESLLHDASFNWQEIFGALISGMLWPWMFLLLRKVRYRLGID